MGHRGPADRSTPPMPRRIDIELTSAQADGSWTWRAAGAKAPKGSMAATLLPPAAKVGDVLRVDAEFFVDGISIVGVLPPKGAREQPELLEFISTAKDEPLVTSTLTSRQSEGDRPRGNRGDSTRDKPRGPRREGNDRPPRKEGGDTARDKPRGPRREGNDRPPRKEGGDSTRDQPRGPRREGNDRPPQRTRPEAPAIPVIDRPKTKRLKAGKAHRSAMIAALPAEQHPIADQIVLGGLPAVRLAITKQNAERTAAGEAAIPSGPLLQLAEKLVPKVRTAEWRDRAEAAHRDLDVLDLRDLRSVVSTAAAAGRDEESQALVRDLQAGLTARVEAEHTAWLTELIANLDVGRIVRALRLSSHPPKAGWPLPLELATRLIDGAGAALTAEAPPDRWVAVLDALAFAPVRDKVIPVSLPKELHPDVRATIARLATRIPKIAGIYEITPDRSAPRPKTERRRPKKAPAKKPADAPAISDAPVGDAPVVEEAPVIDAAPVVDAPVIDATTPEAPVGDAPVDAAPVVDAPVGEAPVIDESTPEAPVIEAPVVEAPVIEAPVVEDQVVAAPITTAEE